MPHHSIPAESQKTSKHNSHRSRDIEPSIARVCKRRDHNPPRLSRQTLPIALFRRQVSDLPQSIDGREHQTHCRSIDTPQKTRHERLGPQHSPQTLHANSESDTGHENTQVSQECAKDSRLGCAEQRKRTEEDGKIEVWSREGLDDGKADEEVSRRHPAWLDDVFAQKRDDHGSAAEYDGPSQVHVREEVESPWGIVNNTSSDEYGDEGG